MNRITSDSPQGGFSKSGERQRNVFWGEMAPCEHLVQIYEKEEVFLSAVEEFVADGLVSGDSVVVIATVQHRNALEDRLRNRGVSLNITRSNDQYIELDAEEALSKFMVDGCPDERLFEELIAGLLARARSKERRVRAFGEMVAILWARGNCGATVRLEHLWHSLCQREMFPLFCAYPKSGFTQDAESSIKEICATHSRLIAG
jgi:hypothetical protein